MELTEGRQKEPARITVLSPHLDDGVLSLGAAIAEWSSSGSEVSIVTVLAGNPGSTLSARPWDQASGFRTAGEASRVRREEDRRACGIIGASPVWLPFGEARDNPGVDDDTIWSAIADAVRGADAVLVPGFPLTYSEHEWLARLVLERKPLARRTGLYVEQPYAYGTVVGWRLASPRNLARLGSTVARTRSARARQEPRVPDVLPQRTTDTVTWAAVPAGREARRTKRRALAEYATQMPRLGRWLPARIAAYESCWGGEGIGWLSNANCR
jgi:LmbE family N-acetylglucosaminyl deacetylase